MTERMFRFFCMIAALVFGLGCASKDFAEPAILPSSGKSTNQTFTSSYSDVWNTTLDSLRERNYPVASSKRENGLVVTDWVLGKSDRLYSGYGDTRIPYNIRFKLSIRLQPSKQGVRVTVTNQEQYYTDAITSGTDFSGSLYQWLPTKSSSAKEAELLTDISKRLSGNDSKARKK